MLRKVLQRQETNRRKGKTTIIGVNLNEKEADRLPIFVLVARQIELELLNSMLIIFSCSKKDT